MKRNKTGISLLSVCGKLAAAVPLLSALSVNQAWAAINVSVVDHSGTAVDGFRWLVETDSTHATTPGVRDVNALSVSFHNSDAPVLAEGQTTGNTEAIASDRINL